MTRSRQDCPPHVLALMLVALLFVIWIGWRALTIESEVRAAGSPLTEEPGCRRDDGSGRHWRGPAVDRLIATPEAAETPGTVGEEGARRSDWRRWRE